MLFTVIYCCLIYVISITIFNLIVSHHILSEHARAKESHSLLVLRSVHLHVWHSWSYFAGTVVFLFLYAQKFLVSSFDKH